MQPFQWISLAHLNPQDKECQTSNETPGYIRKTGAIQTQYQKASGNEGKTCSKWRAKSEQIEITFALKQRCRWIWAWAVVSKDCSRRDFLQCDQKQDDWTTNDSNLHTNTFKTKRKNRVASHERQKGQGGVSLISGRNQGCFLAWKENNPVTEKDRWLWR